ncbi:MAG TPA: acyl-CoA dehydrogenase family protein, partial [Trebonia sp.]
TLPGGGGGALLRPVEACREMPGLAVPPWSMAELGAAQAHVRLDAAAADQAAGLLRLGLAARALAAAARAHEMAVEHAKTRRQFGKVIGSFGAVQQRAASCQIDVSAAGLLLDRAVDAYRSSSHDWLLQAEIAVEFIAAAARRVQLGAQHTLAAVGYFEEHDAPWLFRRVHADTTRLHTLPLRAGDVADILVETPASLPDFSLGPAGESFRAEVREFLTTTSHDPAVMVPAMAERGWFGFGWPAEYGGRDASLAEQVVLSEEVMYARAPVTIQIGSVMLLGNSILRHGTAEQKAAFLPLIRAGKLHFCLGYSEPEAGSDLASLRTKAERDSDDWVINGQKLWTTGGHVASHVWLATRTDPDASPPHAGITVFLIPMDTPGITIQQHRALSGGISCTVFYDNVRVPDSARVGEVNGGWKVITDVLGGELAEAFGEAMLDILGPRAALSGEVPGTPGGGAFEYGLRLSIMYVVGGGTNDIQRGLIARGLAYRDETLST